MATLYKQVPLIELHESKHNPRHRFDEKGLQELTASVKEHGVLTPLLVRQNAKGYEIAAGHRRYRAAKAAGLLEVPVIVREMTDQQFLEILTIENLQREDVHPLEEAAGYRALLQLKGYDVQKIADRVGRSVKYVYDRVKLLALAKEAQKLFFDNRITAGHAIILARLNPADQARALDPDNDDLWQHEHLLYDPDDAREETHPYASLKVASVRELQAWVDGHVRFEAKQADPMLFPETVDTVQAVAEAGRPLVAITHEIMTPEDVKDGPRPILGRSWKRADGKKGSKPCDHSVMGFITIGPGRGEAFLFCKDKQRCRVHWGAEIKAREKRETGAVSPAAQASYKKAELEQQKRQAAEAREKAARARWHKATPAILAALAERVKTLPTSADGVLGQAIITELRCSLTKAQQTLVPRGKSADDLVRHAAFLALSDRVGTYWGMEEFWKIAKTLGLDLKKILDQAAPVEEKTPAKKGKA